MSQIADPRTATAVRSYRLGRTTRQIAAHLGCDEATVRRLLSRRGQVMRPRGSRERSDVSTDAVLTLRGEGLSWHAIADEVGMSYTGVRRRARRAGVEVSC